MGILPDHSPIVRAAVAALDTFGITSRRQAYTALGMWARRDHLSPDDVDAVLSHYPDSGSGGTVYGTTPSAESVVEPPRSTLVRPYTRDYDSTPGGGPVPLPDGVYGFPVGGRAGRHGGES